TMPTFHNPTGTTMSLARRRTLLDIASRRHITIIEDDAYHALRFDSESLPPLVAMDEARVVVYLSSFSKTIAPGLRVGWMITRSPEIRGGAWLRPNGCNPFVASLLVDFVRSGGFERHLDVIRAFYRRSRDICSEELTLLEASGFSLERPAGGFYAW